jgi:hypothetical protein
MNGGKIENCVSGENGGAVAAVGSASKVILAGGEITGNTALTGGGGIYLDASSTVSLSGDIKITGNTLSEDDSANNLETVSSDKLTLTGNLTGKVGLTFPNAKNGTVFGSADNTAFTGAENIYSDSDSELTGTINEESKLVFEKRSAEEINLEEIKKEAEKELKALTDDASSYIAEINSAESAEEVYDIVDTAAEELGTEIINLPYNRGIDLASAEILYQGVSSAGKELSDSLVIKIEDGMIIGGFYIAIGTPIGSYIQHMENDEFVSWDLITGGAMEIKKTKKENELEFYIYTVNADGVEGYYYYKGELLITNLSAQE